MIRQITLSVLLLCSTMAWGENVIARWDFTTGKIDSVDGRFKTRLRGHTSLTGEKKKQYLYVGINLHDRPEGIITVKNYPRLTPQGAFRLEFKAQVREPTGKHTRLILWDSNYYMNPYQSREDFKKGFVLFLQRDKKTDLFRPQAFFGFGKTLDSAAGNYFKLEERRDFTLTMEYDGIRNVSFFLNGKLNRKVALKNGGTLAPSVYPLVIGDRYSGTHSRFDGLIREVTLTALPPSGK